MRLEDVSAYLRPRAPWEAVDLGFALTRRHFPLIISAWLLTVVPLWALLLALAFADWLPFGFVMFLIWWLKPIYDRVPLFILGRALFGAVPRLRDVLRAWPGMLWKRFGRLMFLSRLSSHRALLLPVVELEGLRGRGYAERAKVLKRQAGSTASSLIFFSLIYHVLLVAALICLAGMVISPNGGTTEIWKDFSEAAFVREHLSGWLFAIALGAYLVSLTLVELFYVGGGFGLYLNCRTHLEGWDVELAFKRLVRRLGKVAVVACAFIFTAVAHAEVAREKVELPVAKPASTAADPAVQEVTKDVFKHPDFKIHIGEEKIYNSSSKTPNFGNWSWLAGLGEVLFWMVIAAVVSLLVWFIYVNRHIFDRNAGEGRAKDAKPEGPRTVMGLDLSPESLPDDIVGAARELWRAGDARGALSLLYRGSLSWLVHVARLPVRGSDTEGDCVRIARKMPEPARHEYFESLTSQWVQIAYAEREPGPPEMERLLSAWPFAEKGGAR